MKRCCRCKQQFPRDTGFHRNRSRSDGVADACKNCVSEQRKGKHHYRSRGQEQASRHWNKFRLRPHQYQAMLKKQNGLCAICNRPEDVIANNGNTRELSVDHSRRCCPGTKSCGACVRALLCHRCNLGVGYFREDRELLVTASLYLEFWDAVHERERAA